MVHVPYFSISPWTSVPSNFAVDEWRRRRTAKGRNRALPCGESRLRSNASFRSGLASVVAFFFHFVSVVLGWEEMRKCPVDRRFLRRRWLVVVVFFVADCVSFARDQLRPWAAPMILSFFLSTVVAVGLSSYFSSPTASRSRFLGWEELRASFPVGCEEKLET